MGNSYRSCPFLKQTEKIEFYGVEQVMNKTEIYQFLTEQHIPYEVTEHKAVFNMEERDSIVLPYPEWEAKSLGVTLCVIAALVLHFV